MGNQGQGQGNVTKFKPSQEYERMIKLQERYLPRQLEHEYGYRQQYDPLFTEQALDFQRKYGPQVSAQQMAILQQQDPEWVAAHKTFGDRVQQALERGYVDPQRAAAYGALGKQVTGDTLRGATMDPETLRQTTQAIMSRSPNLSYGEAQDMATAVYTGQRGQQLKQQRQQAANQFLGQQSESDLALTAGGRYMSTPTTTSMLNQIPSAQAPRSFGYENPFAGQQGVQLGLQSQQFNYANQALQGGGGNPWMNALQGAGQGASMGSNFGGYGAAGGAITGGVLGAFGYPQYSDERGKINISRTGAVTADGIPIVEYDYNGKRWRGVTAQDTQKVRPDAVYHFVDGRLGVFYSRIGMELEEVTNG